jgi:tRNA wybutosine-synthesizing protein 2
MSFYRFLCGRLGDSVACDALPRRLRILGHVAVLWLESEAVPAKAMIGQAVLQFNPKIRSVLRRTAAISGPYRQPAVELIAGDTHTETAFRESRCIFHLDPMKVMFSIGNKAERARMSQLGAGELVVDMFAGIGQFSIPMAVHAHPRMIHAIEWNPDAFHYLQQNIQANHVSSLVTPHLGDTAILAPQIAKATADRVLMGLIQGTTKYLPEALACLRAGGILHVHEIGPRQDAIAPTIEAIEGAAKTEGRRVRLLGARTVKTYSPGWNHFVIDARIDDASEH